jgi:hypothetical protein
MTEILEELIRYIKDNFTDICRVLSCKSENIREFLNSELKDITTTEGKLEKLETIKEKYKNGKKLEQSLKDVNKAFHELLQPKEYTSLESIIKKYIKKEDNVQKKIESLKHILKLLEDSNTDKSRVQRYKKYFEDYFEDIKKVLDIKQDKFEDYCKSIINEDESDEKKLEKYEEKLKEYNSMRGKNASENLIEKELKLLIKYFSTHYDDIQKALSLEPKDVKTFITNEMVTLKTMQDKVEKFAEIKNEYEQSKKVSDLIKYISKNYKDIQKVLSLKQGNSEDFKKEIDNLETTQVKLDKLQKYIKDYEYNLSMQKNLEEEELEELIKYFSKNYDDIKKTLDLELENFEDFQKEEIDKQITTEDKIKKLKENKYEYEFKVLLNYTKDNYDDIKKTLDLKQENFEDFQKEEIDKQITTEGKIQHLDVLKLDYISIINLLKNDFEKLLTIKEIEEDTKKTIYRMMIDTETSSTTSIIDIYLYLLYINKGYEEYLSYEASFKDFFDFIKATNQNIKYLIRLHFLDEKQKHNKTNEKYTLQDIHFEEYTIQDVFFAIVQIWHDVFFKYETYFDLYYNVKHMKYMLDESGNSKSKVDYSPHIQEEEIKSFFYTKKEKSLIFKIEYLDDNHFENYSYLFNNLVFSNDFTEDKLIEILDALNSASEIKTHKLFFRYILNYLSKNYFIKIDNIKEKLHKILENERNSLEKLPLGKEYILFIENSIKNIQ